MHVFNIVDFAFYDANCRQSFSISGRWVFISVDLLQKLVS